MTTKARNEEVDSDDCLSEYKYAFREDLLKGQVAFITGGGSGIGFRIAEVLMRHGCDTAIASRRLDRVEKAAQKLRHATGRTCIALKADVRNPPDVEKAIDDILSYYGKIDILVNSAAGNFLCDAENLSYNAYKTVLDIDTVGTFNTSKAVFQKYFKSHGGRIVNISATLAYRGDPLQVHAGTAKAAIDAMTRHLAVEWGPDAVRVNGIAPGPIGGTEGMRKLGGSRLANDLLGQTIPLQRMGQKSEIADAVVFLVSNAATYITGAVLVVDGGNWMTSPGQFGVMKHMLKNKM